MTCDEYLARLSTASLDEIEIDTEYGHPAHCPDCGRVARLVAERERDRIDAFDDLHDLRASAPMRTEHGAPPYVTLSRGGMSWFSIVCAAALATLAWLVVTRLVVSGGTTATTTVVSDAAASFSEEAFRLRCLTGAQAAELVRPHLGLRGNRVMYSPAREPGVLRVVATAEQFDAVRPVIFQHEAAASAACPASVP